MNLKQHDIDILRQLAKEYAEIAALPIRVFITCKLYENRGILYLSLLRLLFLSNSTKSLLYWLYAVVLYAIIRHET